MSAITTHILDLTRGVPAEGVSVALSRVSDGGALVEVGRGLTDADGRIRTLLPSGAPAPEGTYSLRFELVPYFTRVGAEVFFPEATIVFQVAGARPHYHVPLLLSPFGYSTYRGS